MCRAPLGTLVSGRGWLSFGMLPLFRLQWFGGYVLLRGVFCSVAGFHPAEPLLAVISQIPACRECPFGLVTVVKRQGLCSMGSLQQ